MTPPVTLIGLMGAGKSKVGRLAAETLHRPFVDTDRLVEEQVGMTVAQVFESQGEAAFRRHEAAAVVAALERPGAVVSVGGGAVLDGDTVTRMRAAGPVVWLYAEPETLAQRLRKSVVRGDRPLLATADPIVVLRDLLERRRPAYEAAATVVLRTDGCEVAESAQLLTNVIAELDG